MKYLLSFRDPVSPESPFAGIDAEHVDLWRIEDEEDYADQWVRSLLLDDEEMMCELLDKLRQQLQEARVAAVQYDPNVDNVLYVTTNAGTNDAVLEKVFHELRLRGVGVSEITE